MNSLPTFTEETTRLIDMSTLVRQVCKMVRIDEAAMAEVRKDRVITEANIAISAAERIEKKMKQRAGL